MENINIKIRNNKDKKQKNRKNNVYYKSLNKNKYISFLIFNSTLRASAIKKIQPKII